MSFSELKNDAKKSLKGKYGDAIIMIIIYGLIAGVAASIGGVIDKALGLQYESTITLFDQTVKLSGSGIFTIVFTVIVTALVTFGMNSYFLKVSRDEEVTWKELFGKTNLFGFYIVVTLLMGIFISLWTLLLIIPGIIAEYAYSQVYLVKLDNPELGFMDAIKKSKELMKGYKFKYFLLKLSFIGWVILGLFTFGILYFWLAPYMSVTECNFYNKIAKK